MKSALESPLRPRVLRRWLAAVVGLLAVSMIARSADDDHDGIDDAFEDVLIERFAPRLHLAQGEADMPADYRWFVTNSVLRANGTLVAGNAAIRANPSVILGFTDPGNGVSSDFHQGRRYTPGIVLDLDDLHFRGAPRQDVVDQRNVGLYAHVAPVSYVPVGRTQRANYIVIQYFQFFAYSRVHANNPLPCFPFPLDSIVGCALRDEFENEVRKNHEGDWCLFEVFIRETDLEPVVHVWYHHGYEQYRCVAQDMFPDSVRSWRDSKDGFLGKMIAYRDELQAVSSLPHTADVYVGLQGHEFFAKPGQDAFSDAIDQLGEMFSLPDDPLGVVDSLLDSMRDSFQEVLPPWRAGDVFQAARIPNLGEIDYPRPGFELLFRFAGDYGRSDGPQGLMHNAGLAWQWPQTRRLHFDPIGEWMVRPDGQKYGIASFGNPGGGALIPLPALVGLARQYGAISTTHLRAQPELVLDSSRRASVELPAGYRMDFPLTIRANREAVTLSAP